MNPLAPIFDLGQRWVTETVDSRCRTSAEMGGPVRLAFAIGLYVLVCVLAVWIFRREAPRIAEEL